MKTPKNHQVESMGDFYLGRNLRVWGYIKLNIINLKIQKEQIWWTWLKTISKKKTKKEPCTKKLLAQWMTHSATAWPQHHTLRPLMHACKIAVCANLQLQKFHVLLECKTCTLCAYVAARLSYLLRQGRRFFTSNSII